MFAKFGRNGSGLAGPNQASFLSLQVIAHARLRERAGLPALREDSELTASAGNVRADLTLQLRVGDGTCTNCPPVSRLEFFLLILTGWEKRAKIEPPAKRTACIC